MLYEVITENTVIEYVTDTLGAGLKLDKLSVPQVPVRLEMLRNGQIPVACLTDVMAWGLLANGFHIVRDQASSNLEPAVLVVTGDFARKHPADLESFKAKWNEAVERINADPDAYAAMLLELGKHVFDEIEIGAVEPDHRITSYNVCYTKLLRESPGWENGNP